MQGVTGSSPVGSTTITPGQRCVAKGWDEQSFLWGDMLHYRQTTAVPRSLVEQAEQWRDRDQDRCEQLLALAFGWCTHIGGDVIGHSFVNTQAGGPFRNHPTRHHLIENHIDAWVYHQAHPAGPLPDDPIAANDVYPNLTRTGLAFAVHMTPNDPRGKSRPPNLPAGEDAEHDALKVDGAFPKWAAEEIVRALVNVYAPQTRPKEDDVALWSVRPTHPRVYGGQTFQDKINDNLLATLASKIFGSVPENMLAEDIAPTPHVEVPEGFPLPWQVQVCYRLMLTFYGMSYTAKWELDKPRQPDPVILPPTSDFESLLSPPTSPVPRRVTRSRTCVGPSRRWWTGSRRSSTQPPSWPETWSRCWPLPGATCPDSPSTR